MVESQLLEPQASEGFPRADLENTVPQQPVTQDPRGKIGDDTVADITTQWPPSHVYINPALPPTTIAVQTSAHCTEYVNLCAEASAHANLDDSLSVAFEMEKPANVRHLNTPSTREDVFRMLRAANLNRLETKLANGSLIVEAANFAATACWTPASHTVPCPSPGFFDEIAISGRLMFRDFLRQVEMAKEKHLYPISEKAWHLSLMARDPRREYVPGAVRAVVEPFLRLAEEEGVPVWLDAGSERARDVYAHLGFEIVEMIVSKGIPTWCMIKRR